MSEIKPEFNSKIEESSEMKGLPEKLGFYINEKLKGIKQKSAELLKKYPDSSNLNNEVIDIMTEYQLAGEEIIKTKKGFELIRAQIGLIIDRALLYYENGWYDDFKNELYDAVLCAQNEKMDEIVEIIKKCLKGENQ